MVSFELRGLGSYGVEFKGMLRLVVKYAGKLHIVKCAAGYAPVALGEPRNGAEALITQILIPKKSGKT